MRIYFGLFLLFFCTHFSVQGQQIEELATPGLYDTVKVQIDSKTKFPFCSRIYALPSDCVGALRGNCCDYYTHLSKNEKVARRGYINCFNGSSLSWEYYSSVDSARIAADDTELMWTHKKGFMVYESQNKPLEPAVSKIKCFVMDKEVSAYLLTFDLPSGKKDYRLVTYGTDHGYSFKLEYSCMNKLDIQPFLQHILRLE